ncbi:hypothetical protein ACFU51_07555 [Streptomyces sp. NPDC057430]|uniref:hypothetical protein n=1 Tax=Streptomyces sp. NPDC057430 TaxID=3346131 RepID=UPI003699291C
MTTTPIPRPAAATPATPEVHLYRFPDQAGTGVLALFTGSRADQAVAARAADLARSGHPVTAAAVIRSTGFSINALLHHARHRRIQTEADAILAAVLPAIARAGPVRTTTPLVVPARVNPYRTLPAGRVERAAERTGADTILSPVPLPRPTPSVPRRLPGLPDHPAALGPAASGRDHLPRRSDGRRTWHRLPGPAAAGGNGRGKAGHHE